MVLAEPKMVSKSHREQVVYYLKKYLQENYVSTDKIVLSSANYAKLKGKPSLTLQKPHAPSQKIEESKPTDSYKKPTILPKLEPKPNQGLLQTPHFTKEESLDDIEQDLKSIKTHSTSQSVDYDKKSLAVAHVLLVEYQLNKAEHSLLKNMTKAIHDHLSNAVLIDGKTISSTKEWESLFKQTPNLKLIIISEMNLYALDSLMPLYKRLPKRSICSIPIFLLADLSAYLMDPALKKPLWEKLQQVIDNVKNI